MDQSKWSIPRCRHGVLTKSIAKYDRPRTKLQGVWLHSVCLCMYALDVRQSADGSMVAECLSKAFDKMLEICRARHRPPPKRIVLWEACQEQFRLDAFEVSDTGFLSLLKKVWVPRSKLLCHSKVDNTVRESKNNTILKLMSFMLLQKGLQFTALMMSRVGHTHSTLGPSS